MSAMAQMVLPSLAGRRVVVTGGASGIGRCLVEAFLAQGCTVDAIDFDAAAADALRAANPDARLAVRLADLADPAARAAAMQAVADAGRIDVMVTNAADDTRHAWSDVTPESWQRTLAINLDHQFFCAQAAARAMTAQGSGVIVMLGSVTARRGSPAMAGYLVAKGGVEAMVRGLARELGPAGVRVVGVVPGAIDTERQRRLWQTPERVEQILATQAIRQRLDGWDVAQMVLFLASDNARGCTAQSYVVDAGLT
jgi:NAD(P)-dependent dehydrogenase (short-subunit alcohol dehydrogenase family)